MLQDKISFGLDMLSKLQQMQQDAMKAQTDFLGEVRDTSQYIMMSTQQPAPHYFVQVTRKQALRLELMADDLGVSIEELIDQLLKK